MKWTTYIVIMVLLFLFMSHTTVTFKPFSISMPYWYRGLGVLLMFIGLSLLLCSEREMGFNNGVDYVLHKLEKKVNDKGL